MRVFSHSSVIQFLFSFLLASVLKKAQSQQDGYQGCFDPVSGERKVTLGEPHFLCLMIGAGDDWSSGIDYIRLTFSPEADEYSRFHVPGSYADMVINSRDGNGQNTIFRGQNITIGLATQNALSFVRKYWDSSKQFAYPYLTAIIDVSGGVVTGITWDDSCVFCGGNECEENTLDYNGVMKTQAESGQPSRGCYVPAETCNQNFQDRTENVCDVTVHVVWTGSDSNGKSLLSSAFRYSAFPAQEVKDRVTRNLPQLPTFPGSNSNNANSGN